jgi:hypothetical protein
MHNPGKLMKGRARKSRLPLNPPSPILFEDLAEET